MGKKINKIRTRFAPSPTGELHIGGARTALFNFLFAKSKKGEFLLRIEDTDRDRIVPGSEKRIKEALKWLGLKWDKRPLVQSKRKKIYLRFAKKLVKEGKAYYCFCSEKRLSKIRKEMELKGLPPSYDRHCRNLEEEEIRKYLKEKKKWVIRLKVPLEGKITVKDEIHGRIEFDLSLIDDQILIKSDGFPTYHLASVVDDHLSKINWVIRSDEWLSSTPKHLLLYKYFNWKPPKFAHLPMILGSDKKKLSKRHGALSILEFKKQGYLPDALINFMAFLGWNPKTEEEIFSLKELIRRFSLNQVGKSSAIFNLQRLEYLNGYYIRNKSDKELVKIIRKYKGERIAGDKFLEKIIHVIKDRLKKLSEFDELADYFFTRPSFSPSILIFKKSNKEATLKGLSLALIYLLKFPSAKWTIENLQNLLSEVVEKENLTNGDVFWPVRVALSGKEASPSPAELLWVFGKKESLERVKKAIELLKSSRALK